MPYFARVIWIVLDSVGIGELPDAAEYGDVGRDTLGHIARSRPLALPNLVRLGLANIEPLEHLTPPAPRPAGLRQGRHAFAGEGHHHGPLGNGRHLAGAGVPGLPARLSAGIDRAIREPLAGARIGNKPACGTEILKELGEEHVRTGFPIVYYVGRQRFSDRRARRCDSRRRALSHVRNRAENCWTVRIASAA